MEEGRILVARSSVFPVFADSFPAGLEIGKKTACAVYRVCEGPGVRGQGRRPGNN